MGGSLKRVPKTCPREGGELDELGDGSKFRRVGFSPPNKTTRINLVGQAPPYQ